MPAALRHRSLANKQIAAPDLLRTDIYFAWEIPDTTGHPVETTGRYAQAFLYRDLARAC